MTDSVGLADTVDVPVIPDVSTVECELDADCDDGMGCTTNTCVAGECHTSPTGTCAWPAEALLEAVNLTPVEGPFINDFHENLSGAVWDPGTDVLWVCRNNNPSKIWALEPSGQDSFVVAERSGERAKWTDFGDLEGLTLATLDEPNIVYLMVQGGGHIRELDLSTGDSPVSNNDWNLNAVLGRDGAEGITFVPDEYLESDGFVGLDGEPRPVALWWRQL